MALISTDASLSQVVFNVLNKSQYDSMVSASTVASDQLYLITDSGTSDNIILTSPSINIATTPSSDIYGTMIMYEDGTGTRLGEIRPLYTSGGVLYNRIGVRRDIGGSYVYNFLNIGVDAYGNRIVNLEKDIWNKALYSVGDIIITSTNTNPAANHGGTWTLIDKEFTPLAYSSTDTGAVDPSTYFTINTTYTDYIRNLIFRRSGHQILIAMRIKTKTDLGTTDRNLGTVNLTALGVSGWWHNSYWVGFAEPVDESGTAVGSNGIVSFLIGNQGGLNFYNSVSRESNNNILAGSTIFFTVTNTFTPTDMDDAACNKFYWQRTA